MLDKFEDFSIKGPVYFLGYQVTMLLTYLIIVSILAYFHFLLDHSLSVIEDWIFDHGWEIVIASKLLSLFIIVNFLNVQTDERAPLRKYLLDFKRNTPREIFVIIMFLFVLMVFLGNPIYSNNPNAGIARGIISYVGIYLFFMCDLIVTGLIGRLFPNDKKYSRFIFIAGYALTSYLFSKNLFLFASNMNALVLLNFFLVFFLSYWRELNWSHSSLFCLLFLGPFAAIFGFDPIWSKSYSFFEFSSPINLLKYFVLFSLSFIYLIKKENVEQYESLDV